MDYTDLTFVEDLQNALRCGMTEALRQFRALTNVDVKGVERTLYPIIREYALKYLDSIGYSYLTKDPSFFVIGETTISGTSKRADGFICSPELGEPIYAIEVGISDSSKFWEDYEKSVDEWSRTGIFGVFILFFDSTGDDVKLNRLDGAILRTPKSDNFRIMPLILPLDPSFDSALESITYFQYFSRHNKLTLRAITLSDRTEEAHRWTTNIIAPLLEKQNKFLINRILSSKIIDRKRFKDALSISPELIVLQGGICPFKNFDEDMRKKFDRYVKEKEPIIVIIADWLEKEDWESDSIMSEILPVEFLGSDHKAGKWDYFNSPLYFGKEIIPADNAFLDLKELSNSNYCVKGFTKTKLKTDRFLKTDMKVKIEEEVYPFIVSAPSNKIVFVASGAGGWGQNWYGKYVEGYQLLWREILEKFK